MEESTLPPENNSEEKDKEKDKEKKKKKKEGDGTKSHHRRRNSKDHSSKGAKSGEVAQITVTSEDGSTSVEGETNKEADDPTKKSEKKKHKKKQIPAAIKVSSVVIMPQQLVSPTDVVPAKNVARPGSITTVDLRHSTTLAASQVGGSESTLRELARRGMADVLAFHHGVEERVMKDVTYPETGILKTAMLFDSTTGLPNVSLLRKHLMREGKLSCGAVKLLLSRSSELLRKLPNVAHVKEPVVICGDLHGQFYDMLTIFDLAGHPSTGTKYLFLGDYVDRGFFSSEIVLYLCALMLCHPENITLLRGNHETRLMCEFMTFRDECLHKYNSEIYEAFQDFFQSLQIAAIVHGTPNGDCLCVHGGIGPELKAISDFENINRFCEVPKKSPFWDVVWADPLPELDSGDMEFDSAEKWETTTFVPNTFRHSSCLYGLKATRRFLKHNKLCTIIRGHQVQQEGYFEHFSRTSHNFAIAPVLTVFSAPNYCDQYGNRGAFIQVQSDRFVVQQFYDVSHPHVLPGFSDSITWSLPMLLEGIVSILQKLVLSMINEGSVNPESLTPEERAKDEALAAKTHKLLEQTKKLQEEKAAFRKIQDESYHKNMSLFERVLRADSENEACPNPATSSSTAPAPARLAATKKYASFRY